MNSFLRILGFIIVLTGFWLINSGYFKPLLLGFGVVSIILVILIVERMRKKDQESFPILIPTIRLPGFLLWMVWQIILSNIDVAKRIWMGKKSISPVIITLKASQKTEVAKVLYANSITMTPGTVTLSVRDNLFEVHALTRAAAQDLQKGEMDRRIKALEGKA